jgi:hypothetical protein
MTTARRIRRRAHGAARRPTRGGVDFGILTGMVPVAVMRRRRARIAVLVAGLCIVAPVALAQDSQPILGGDGPDMLNGTAGNDALYGLGGADVVNGLAGDDELDGGPGADTLSGGPGSDAVSYGGAGPVTVTLNGRADDGHAGEGDNVRGDVEDIFGSDGGDRLTGSAKANTIDGGAGADVIDGRDGADHVYGGDGNDIVAARDGTVDWIDCGPGRDRATVDRGDRTRGCELVDYPTLTPGFILAGFPTRSGSRLGSVRLVGVVSGSRIVVACRSGCRPGTSRTRALARRQSARVTAGRVRISLPARAAVVGGTTFEVGVTAPRAARGRCSVFRVAPRLRGLSQLRSRTCVTIARVR